jgi:hypothetical protein
VSLISDFVEQVVRSALSEGMRKFGGKRRRGRLSPSKRIAREIERMIKPAKRQVSRKRTVRSRSKYRRRSY